MLYEVITSGVHIISALTAVMFEAITEFGVPQFEPLTYSPVVGSEISSSLS